MFNQRFSGRQDRINSGLDSNFNRFKVSRLMPNAFFVYALKDQKGNKSPKFRPKRYDRTKVDYLLGMCFPINQLTYLPIQPINLINGRAFKIFRAIDEVAAMRSRKRREKKGTVGCDWKKRPSIEHAVFEPAVEMKQKPPPPPPPPPPPLSGLLVLLKLEPHSSKAESTI